MLAGGGGESEAAAAAVAVRDLYFESRDALSLPPTLDPIRRKCTPELLQLFASYNGGATADEGGDTQRLNGTTAANTNTTNINANSLALLCGKDGLLEWVPRRVDYVIAFDSVGPAEMRRATLVKVDTQWPSWLVI